MSALHTRANVSVARVRLGCVVSWIASMMRNPRVQAISYERSVCVCDAPVAFAAHHLPCRYAKFEMSVHDVARARACYERALESLGEEAHSVSVCVCVCGFGCAPGVAAPVPAVQEHSAA